LTYSITAWRDVCAAIWLRRPTLIDFVSTIPELETYLSRPNPLQIEHGVREFWAYGAFTMKLKLYEAD